MLGQSGQQGNESDPSGGALGLGFRSSGTSLERGDAGALGTPLAGGGGPSGSHGFAMLRRSRWLVFGVFALVSMVTIPCIWVFLKPAYRANAVVRVSPVVSRVVFRTEDNGIVPLYRSYLNTQVSVISSPTVLRRVLDRSDVHAAKWYEQKPPWPLAYLRSPPSPMDRLEDCLTVRSRRNTEMIDVAITALDPHEARLLVDAVVDEYKRLNDEAAAESDIQRTRTLIDERNALQRQIDGLADIKHKASMHLGTMTAEQLRSLLSKNVTGLEVEYEGLRRELALARWELGNLTGPGDADHTPEGGSDRTDGDETARGFFTDPEWRRLNLDLRTARHQLELARQHYGESHPRIQTLLASADFAERVLREREAQLGEQRQGTVPQFTPAADGEIAFLDRTSLERHVQRLEYQVKLLGDDIERQRSRVANVGDVAQDMAHYDEEIKRKRDLLDRIRERLTTLEVESKAPGRITVASHAIAPSRPYRDRRALLTAMALVGSLLLGVGVGYLRAITDQKIREVGDVEQTVRVPFLGALPPLPDSSNLLGEWDPVTTENVRMVRTALLQRLTGSGKRVILITSSSSRAGKSTVAILLCKSLGQLGKRTLLVEADLHQPSLGGYLGIDANAGLARLLTDGLDDRDVIRSIDRGRFDVLLAGERTEEFNFELLANGVFSACLERWKQSYDYIVLDSPPFLPVADSRILAGQVDGTIMVLRSAYSRRNEVVQAYAELSAGGGTLLGTVLVGARVHADYGYYGHYGDYRRSIAARGAKVGDQGEVKG